MYDVFMEKYDWSFLTTDNVSPMNSNTTEYCDESVKTSDKKYISKFNIDIKTLNKNEKLENLFKKHEDLQELTLMNVFTNQDNTQIVIYAETEDSCFTNNCFGMIQNDDLVFVGVSGGHPYIYTPKFIYNNSDGSCVEIELTNTNSIVEIVNNVYKYYYNFCDDDHH